MYITEIEWIKHHRQHLLPQDEQMLDQLGIFQWIEEAQVSLSELTTIGQTVGTIFQRYQPRQLTHGGIVTTLQDEEEIRNACQCANVSVPNTKMFIFDINQATIFEYCQMVETGHLKKQMGVLKISSINDLLIQLPSETFWYLVQNTTYIDKHQVTHLSEYQWA